MKLKLSLLIVLIQASTTFVSAQVCLDDFCFLTTTYSENISKDLKNGYRAFIIRSDITNADLVEVDNFLRSNSKETIVLISTSDYPNLYNELSAVGLTDHLYDRNAADSLFGIVMDSLDRFFVFASDNKNFLPIDKHISQYSSLSDSILAISLDENPHNYLTHFYFSDQTQIEDERKTIESLIANRGRLPNFLETLKASEYSQFIDSLNAINKFRAIVINDENDILEQVSWNELPELESSGKIHITERIISPFKRGFKFSPDVSTYTPTNNGVIKVFYAYHQDFEEGLMMQLDFENSIVNKANPDDKYLYEFVKYEYDEKRGYYSQFDGQTNYIDFGIPSGMDFKEITISTWIKPDTLEGNLSMIGIGEVFSAKVFNGGLTFTTPAIQDHRADSARIKQDQWQHVAIVYQANKEVNFYYNGVNVENQPASDITISSNSLLIGSNLWSEYFKGGIDDLYIWNRVLSDDEIMKVYNLDLEKTQSELSFKQYLIVIIIFIGFLVIFLFWRGKRGRVTVDTKPIASKQRSFAYDNRDEPGIYLFGGFRLINRDCKNLTTQFSPKRQELFILVLLYTFFKNGINSKRMSEILWEGHSFESAKNNRSTQMKDIRGILDQSTGVSIEYDNKNWKIKIDEDVRWDFSDYADFRNLLSDNSGKETIESDVVGLLNIINQGTLLPNMHYEWLDPIKGQLSEEIIEVLTLLLEKPDEQLNPDMRLKISNAIFALDPLNEKSLRLKIKLLVSEGKHTLAKNTFDQFCNSYLQFYGEEYKASFSNFV